MSGICGWVAGGARGAPNLVERMIAAIDYRGDTSALGAAPQVAMGYRFWQGRPQQAPGVLQDATALIACAGTFTLAGRAPLDWLRERLSVASPDLGELDGAFAFAHWNVATRTLTLARDPFGIRSLYYVQHEDIFYFATEIKQLLEIPGLPVRLDPSAIHKYLTFSFVPGVAVPIVGIRRLLPGHTLTLADGQVKTAPYFQLVERLDDSLREPAAASRTIRRLTREATERRLHGEPQVGLFLSGGLDSSSVAVWLKDAGASVHALSLDFGERGVEREEATSVASTLGIPQTWVPITGDVVAAALTDVVHKLDLPFGDAVTVPQYLLGKAARQAGLDVVWNGEGGDQLFGGWTGKPMIAAEVYAGLYHSQEDSREEAYLRSYHRFYGLEDELYTPDFAALVGPPGQRRAHLRPYLEGEGGETFLNRVRLADISLKGSQNILPRAERMAGCWGLDVSAPLFDRKLAETSFRLPTDLKLHGACEKYVLKLSMQNRLPENIVWRKKFGMSVPITDLVQSPAVAEIVADLLGDASVRARGLFRPSFVQNLRAGIDVPGETRRRRIGERLWTLVMLEAWMRRFVDGRNQRAAA